MGFPFPCSIVVFVNRFQTVHEDFPINGCMWDDAPMQPRAKDNFFKYSLKNPKCKIFGAGRACCRIMVFGWFHLVNIMISLCVLALSLVLVTMIHEGGWTGSLSVTPLPGSYRFNRNLFCVGKFVVRTRHTLWRPVSETVLRVFLWFLYKPFDKHSTLLGTASMLLP